MTLHKSLRSESALRRARNVLDRAERLKILEEDGRWAEGKSVFGLPKVRSFVMKRRHAKAAKKEEVAVGVEGAAAEAAPAAAATAGKGAPAAKGAPAKAAPAAAGKPSGAGKAASSGKAAGGGKGAR